jgi:zinc transporter ZupT
MAATVEKKRSLVTRVAAALLLLAAVFALFRLFDATVSLRESPPVESLAFERVTFDDGSFAIAVRNDGPDPVTIAQLLINDAYWTFETSRSSLDRLDSSVIRVDYPWEEGLPLNLAIVTSTGVTIEHEVEAAVLTPEADGSTFLTYSMLGLYIGVIPVGIGLFAFPFLRRISRRALGFFLALTVGLLVFLLVDTVAEGFELAGEAPVALDGIGLFFIGALAAVAALTWLEERLDARRSASGAVGHKGFELAYLVAAGIGLHNLGEGLAVGSAIAAGEVALGTFLVIGFALHNTTEGLAIVAPLGAEERRPALWHFALLGAVAGAPTIAGAWVGGFVFSSASAAFMFGLAAGAIAQVILTISRGMRGEMSLSKGAPTVGFLAGLLVMYGTGLLVT